MNIGIENGDINGGHCYMNIPTASEAKNHNSIYSKKKEEISPNISETQNTGLQDDVEIDVMLPASTIHQYDNM